MPRESEKLEVGDAAPEFCLSEGLEGEEVCLRDYRGHKLLLMFMRGSW
jgi:peroxiredoxin